MVRINPPFEKPKSVLKKFLEEVKIYYNQPASAFDVVLGETPKKQCEDAAEFSYIDNVFSVFIIPFLILEWNIYPCNLM